MFLLPGLPLISFPTLVRRIKTLCSFRSLENLICECQIPLIQCIFFCVFTSVACLRVAAILRTGVRVISDIEIRQCNLVIQQGMEVYFVFGEKLSIAVNCFLRGIINCFFFLGIIRLTQIIPLLVASVTKIFFLQSSPLTRIATLPKY